MSIKRRDFLNGAALTIAAGLVPWRFLRAESRVYPPALTGLRGSHVGSFEVAHQLGWERKVFATDHLPQHEDYDLVVVGAGISGLAAACFYRERHPQARFLLLDNHDDFGGHAKRNEFRVGGRLLLGYGGSESLDSPKANFSAEVQRLLAALGVKLERFHQAFQHRLYDELDSAVFFDQQTFGEDRLVVGEPDADAGWAGFIGQFPLPESDRAALLALYAGEQNYLQALPLDEREAYLDSLSYQAYLKRHVGLSDKAIAYFQQRSSDEYGYRIDFLPASYARYAGYPGFAGLGLEEDDSEEEPYIYHFPDGNAGVARLLVRDLIPAVAAGQGMDDVVLAAFDYSRLDRPEHRVRLRLSSTVVSVRNREGGVDIGYSQAGQLYRVRARQSVLACYNMLIPYILRDLPAPQAQALAQNVKLPMVYANVVIRNWQSWAKLGIQEVYAPGMPFSLMKLDYPVDLGGYQAPNDPEQPICLHLVHVPHASGVGPDLRTQARAARMQIYTRTFADYEAQIRDQLQRVLGGGGFDHQRDVLAITVNRWPHGYSYYSNPLFDGPDGGAAVMQRARQPLGAVAIANSDAGWDPYLHAAVDQAWRAFNELSEVVAQ